MTHEHEGVVFHVKQQHNGLWEYWFVDPHSGKVRSGKNKSSESHALSSARFAIDHLTKLPDLTDGQITKLSPDRVAKYFNWESEFYYMLEEAAESWYRDNEQQAADVFDLVQWEREFPMRLQKTATLQRQARYELMIALHRMEQELDEKDRENKP